MPSFYGQDDPDRLWDIDSFSRRFEQFDWILGRIEWQAWLRDGDWTRNPSEALDALVDIFASVAKPLKCPRVFVSHRRKDTTEAMRIAWLASGAGFQFWIDLLDPNLQYAAGPGALSQPQAQAVLVASIIELALLNCSHVMAALTENSRGSLWIPYEYGRIKRKGRVRSRNAAVWLKSPFDPADDPEYTALCVRTSTEPEISQWFMTELLAWQTQTRSCPGGAGGDWTRDEPPPL